MKAKYERIPNADDSYLVSIDGWAVTHGWTREEADAICRFLNEGRAQHYLLKALKLKIDD